MAEARKLKGEIDRTLKKVQEGQEEFEELWNQVHSCDNANLREKLEDQLKKEIKKLQRLREQIKGWIANADIKDKQPLLDARKSIEKDMERFKACEREMKMAGRAGMPKPTDPKEKAKEDAKDWINAAVDTLQTKVDEMEYEIEELQGGMKKKQKPPARLSELEEVTTRHKDHIARLEKVLRCIDNETIQPDESGMETLKGDMDIYLADQCEDNGLDAADVGAMYEELADRLEAVDLAAPAAQAAHAHAKLGKAKDKEKEEAEKERERERERENEKQRAAVAAAKAQLIAQGNNNIKLNDEEDTTTRGVGKGGGTAAASKQPSLPLPAPAATPAAAAAAATAAAQVPPLTPVPAQPPPPPPPATTARSIQSPVEKSTDGSTGTPASANGNAAYAAAQPPATPRGQAHQEPSPTQSMATPVNQTRPAPGFAAPTPGAQTPVTGARGPPPGMAPAATPPGTPTPPVWGDAGPSAANAAGAAAAAGKGNIITKLVGGQVAAAPAAGAGGPGGPVVGRGPAPGAAGPAAARAPPPGYGGPAPPAKAMDSMDGSANNAGEAEHAAAAQLRMEPAASGALPDGPAKSHSLDGSAALPPLEPPNLPPVTPVYAATAAKQILEACYARFQPQPSDTDWRAYRPRHPTHCPASYPKTPHDVIEHPSLFRKMDPECLFFAFYFQPDSYQQFLAAHELKRQSWRFHKHHTAWFQRFTEPTITNEEYEQGAYVYFDYNIVHDDNQTGWCYRRKENFTFRYDALEDELRPPANANPAAS